MKLFFPRARTILGKQLTDRTLYAFDFDGTLAPLVSRPEDAQLCPRTRELLTELARVAPVAIITGRSVADLRSRLELDLPSVQLPYLVGNHGLEGITGTASEFKSALARAQRHCKIWRQALQRQSLPAGIEIEDKRYSLAVHYRLSRNKLAARERLRTLIDGLKPAPRVVGGKAIFNLVEPCAPHKGTAILELMKKLKLPRAIYIGDDDTDEDVFRLHHPSILSVRVGKKNQSDADYYIARQFEINRMLELLIQGASARN